MFESFAVRHAQGTQYIANLRAAQPAGFRAKPVIAADACAPGCTACTQVCPSHAIRLDAMEADAVAIDLGRCVMCGDCAPVCPTQKLSFSNDVRLCASHREDLLVTAARPSLSPVAVSAELKKRFGRSLKLRSVSAGGCNGCEMEVNAWGNVNFDLGRYGIDIVASPRHADGLVLTGPITRNMMEALQLAWEAIPEPRIVIAVGTCAISGGVYAESPAVAREFLQKYPPTLYVPGCPAHPLTFINGIMDLLGIPST